MATVYQYAVKQSKTGPWTIESHMATREYIENHRFTTIDGTETEIDDAEIDGFGRTLKVAKPK